jgi:phage RecT family recombinase
MTDANELAPVKKELAPLEAVRLTIHQLEGEFAAALPPQIPAKKFVRTVMTALQMQPDLIDADRRSLLAACMKAAQDGLYPDGREAAFIVFRTKRGPMAQYLPMIGGLLKRLRNSGELASVAAHVAYETDEFRYELGDEEKIVHRPSMAPDRGKPVAAYAIAKTKDGAIYREVMSVAQVEQVRDVSRAKDAGPWVTWWEEMARKTVLRRLMKRLPSSADVDRLVEHDDETYDLRGPGPVVDLPEPTGTSRLATKLGMDAETPPPPSPEPTPLEKLRKAVARCVTMQDLLECDPMVEALPAPQREIGSRLREEKRALLERIAQEQSHLDQEQDQGPEPAPAEPFGAIVEVMGAIDECETDDALQAVVLRLKASKHLGPAQHNVAKAAVKERLDAIRARTAQEAADAS